MLFIDLEQLPELIGPKLAVLESAHAAVLSEEDEEARGRLIEQRRGAWVAVREELDRLSHGKCWYTECRNPGTDDDVDHFRPKGPVAGVDGHPGYFWLAFDWHNLRLSCHRSNRFRRNQEAAETGGKGNKFPLLNGSYRAYHPADDLGLEHPAFLDPTNPTDPPLLTFLPNGEAALAPDYSGNSIAAERFEATRLGLHLNWPSFVEDRLRLYWRIDRLVRRGVRESPESGAQHGASQAFKDVLRDLRQMMQAEEVYSAAAAAYIETFGHIWWVKLIVLKLK